MADSKGVTPAEKGELPKGASEDAEWGMNQTQTSCLGNQTEETKILRWVRGGFFTGLTS